MKYKILVTSSHYEKMCAEAKKLLESKGCKLEINNKNEPFYTFEELAATIGDVDAAIIGLDNWNEEVYKIAPKLKVITKFGVGVDNIDLKKAKEYGIKVLNARGGNANAVAELAVGMILDLMRNISPLNQEMKVNNWLRHVGFELKDQTVGLLGFGDISQRVAKKLTGFDVKVMAYDPYPNHTKAKEFNVEMVDEATLLNKCNIVSIHIPNTKENFHYINSETIGKMKKGSYIINTARGALIDTDALCDAVESGYLAGAATDVYEQEPLPKDARILRYPQIVTLPHSGAETFSAYHNIGLITANGVLDVLEGREPQNWLNK